MIPSLLWGKFLSFLPPFRKVCEEFGGMTSQEDTSYSILEDTDDRQEEMAWLVSLLFKGEALSGLQPGRSWIIQQGDVDVKWTS